MRKTTKSLASLLLVMAMVFTMIPASLFTASAAEHVLSFYAIDGSGDFTFTNVVDGKTFGNNLLRAGFKSGSKGTSNESFSFKAGKRYTFKIVGGVSDFKTDLEIANIYINDSKVGDFGKTDSLNYSSVYGCHGFEKTFTYTATADVTAPVVVEFKDDTYKVGFYSLTISGEFGSGGQSTDTDPTTDTDTPSSGSETVIWQGSHNVSWIEYKLSEQGDVKFVPGSIRNAQAGDKIIFTYTATDNYPQVQFFIKAPNWQESQFYFDPSKDATTYEIVLTAKQASDLNSAQDLIIKGKGLTVTKIVYESQNASVKYTVTANASPVAGGTVTGGGTYEEGSSVTVTATPNSGYVFKAWNNGTSDVSTDASYTFTASANVTLTASFVKVIKEYTVTIGSTNGGTATVNGEATATVEEGTTVELKATPAEGYQFVGWLVDNTNISAANPYTYTVNGDVTVTPVFEKIKSSVTVTVTPDGAGTVTGAGDYESGSTATLKATPKAGYEFSGWIIDGETVATTSTVNITVGTSDINVTAKFVPKSITVTVIASPTEGGTVTGAGNYNYGTKATLVATPNEGYRFVGWYVDGYFKSKDATFSYAVPTDNVKVTASFEEIVYYTVTTTTNNANYGSVTAGNTYEAGTQITLKATPASDAYKFVGWYDGDTKVSDNASYTFDVKEDVTLEARFAEIVKYTVTVEAGANGKVSGGGTFEEGTQVTVKATANTGYAFKGWYVDGSCKSADASYTFVVDSNITLTAEFEEVTKTNTLKIEAESATLFDDSSVFTVQNKVDENYGAAVSGNWLRVEGDKKGEAYYPVMIPDAEGVTYTIKLCYANDGWNDRHIAVNVWEADENGTTTIEGVKYSKAYDVVELNSNGKFADGCDVVLSKLTLEPGLHYIGLYGENWAGFDYIEIVASQPVLDVVVPTYTVNATVSGNGTIAVDPAEGPYKEGSTVTVTVTPAANYAVAYWTVNGEQIASTANTYTIDSIDKNYTISAKLVTAYSVITQIKAADKEHPYAFAEIELPKSVYPELYDEANWKNGFDLVCSYYLTNYTFKGEAEAIFAVKTSSGKYYYQQATHNLANQSITISNCWYDPDDEVVSVILLVTNFCPEMYKDGEIFKEHGDLMINLNMTFTVYELITRDTPYVDLSNKTDNYIIYGNEIPVMDSPKPSDWNNNNGNSWVTFDTVIDEVNEFEHRVWEIEYEFDRKNEDWDADINQTVGGVYAGRYYIVPDGDISVDATGGAGFSFYYRTEESNDEGIWITLQSNLFTTHEGNDQNREPMKVYLEPTGGEWEACFVAYDLSQATGETITYWDFFVDGSNTCKEANGTYTYVDPTKSKDYIHVKSEDTAKFWFSELRLEHYSLITVTYRDQFGKLIDRRITNVGTIQDPPEHIERTGYTFLYWTLGEDVVGEVWRDADGNIVAPGTEGAKVENDGHFDKPVTEQRLYVAHYEYNGDLYQITVQNGAIINMGTEPITEVDCRYETVLQLKADEKASDFAYWVYADYDLVDGEKTNIKYSILSYKPSFYTSVMGNADYIAVYEDDIAAGKEYVVKPLLAYYTVDKTGNNTRYFLSSKGMKLYTSIFNRADVFDSYHDKLHNKISFLCTIAYDEDIYDPIGWGTIVTNNKLTADTVGGADSVKDGTTSDELVITYENFLSATWYWTNVGAQKATIQKTTWTRTDVWDTILAGGQYLMSYTNLNNGIDRHARTFLIAEVLADGSVHMVFSDEYTTGTISGKPATVNINVTIKVNGTVVETTTEGRVVTDTKSKCYTTGSGEVITTATGFVRATPAVGYTFVGWDTNGDGTADITSNKYDYANLTSDVNLTALFKKADTIYVTATVATANGGRISSSVTNNQITAGESVTIYAVPNSGFTFLGWYVSPNDVGISYIPTEYTSTDASYTFVPTKDCYAYAYFAETGSTAKTYTITIADAVGGTATVNGATSATATYGEKVTLVATPAAGYTFAYWMINDVNSSTSATLEYAVSNNVTITPVFNAENIVYTDKFTIEAEGYTDAQYVLSGSAVLTGTDGDITYSIIDNDDKDVQVVPFTAPADGKYTFTYYYQRKADNSEIHFDIFTTSSSDLAQITIDGVTYYETYYNGKYSNIGKSTDDYDSVAVGTWGVKAFPMEIELKAGETILIGLCDNNGNAYFDKVVVTADAEVFEESVKPTVTIVATNGKVTDGKSEVVTGQYTVGTTLTLYPEQNLGYIFKEWRDGKGNVLSTDVEYTFTVEADTTVEAVFEAYTSVEDDENAHDKTPETETVYNVTVGVQNDNTVIVKNYFTGDKTNNLPNYEGYYLDTITGESVSFTVVDRKMTLIAKDKVVADGEYNIFLGWRVNGVLESGYINEDGDHEYKTEKLSKYDSLEIVAVYSAEALAEYTITVEATNGSVVDADDNVITSVTGYAGSSATLFAAPEVGYIFSHWTLDGVNVGTAIPYSVTITGNATLVAVFVPYVSIENDANAHINKSETESYYDLTVSVENGNSAIVKNYYSTSAEGYYLDTITSATGTTFAVPADRKVTLTAVDKEVVDGVVNIFVGWYQDGVLLSTDRTCQIAKRSTATTVVAKYSAVNSLDVTINYLGASEITYNGKKGTSFSIDAPVNGTTYTFTLGEVNNYYEFLGWYVGDECISTSTTLKYVYDAANGSVEIVAKYAFVSVDTMPIISIITSDQNTTNADPQDSNFNAITSDYVKSTVSVLNGDAYDNYSLTDATAEVKGRGNSTWSSAEKNNLKRPIRIKFDKKDKQNLLNLNTTPVAELRNWVLLANNIDRSMYRNALAFELGNALTNIPFTSNYANVEVYINGVYQGVYLLCEQSEADETRNNIAEPENDSVTEVDAFIELDNVQNHKNNGETPDEPVIEGATYDDGDYYFLADKNGTYSFTTYQDPCFTIKSDIFSLAQYNYIKNTVKAAQNTIYDGTKEQIEKVIDVNSFVDMYILQEIAKNIDVGYSSFYMMLKGGKLYLTNPWDFDKAFGDDDRADSTTGLYVGEKEGADDSRNYNPWFVALLDKTWFKNLVEARWTALYDAGTFTTVAETIKADYNSKAASLARNWTMWKDKMDDKLDNEPSTVLNYSSHKQAFDGLMSWYEARIAYINSKYYNGTGTGGEGGEGGETTDGTVSADGTTLTIEAETATLSSNSSWTTKNGDTYYGTFSGSDWIEMTGESEIYLPFEVTDTTATYTINVRYVNHDGGKDPYINIWIPAESGTPIGGSNFNKHGSSSSNALSKTAKAFNTATINDVQFTTTGTHYIGLYGKQYAGFDYVEIVANKEGAFSAN